MRRVLVGLFCLAFQADVCASTQYLNNPHEFLSSGTGLNENAINPTVSDDGSKVVFEQEGRLFLVQRTPSLGAPQPLFDCQPTQIEDYCFEFPSEERPRISGNGRFIVFQSRRSFAGIATDSNFALDVYRYDLQTEQFQLVSASSLGVVGNADSEQADVSRDGRYVAFSSRATNLITGMTTTANRPRTFWKDLQTQQTRLMPSFGSSTNEMQSYPRISSNGRRVLSQRFLFGFSTPQSLYVWDTTFDTLLFACGNQHPLMQGGSFGPPDVFSLSSDGFFNLSITIGGTIYQPVRHTGFTTNSCGSYGFAGILYGDDSGFFGVSQDLSSGGGFLALNNCYFFPSTGFGSQVYALTGDRNLFVRLGKGVYESCAQGFDMTPNGRFMVLSTADLSPHSFFGFGTHPFSFDTDGFNDIVLIDNPLWSALPQNVAVSTSEVPASSRRVQVSGDGKLALFESDLPASAFSASYVDTNNAPDVFLFDRDAQTIELISTVDGVTALPGGASHPKMDERGENIVFQAPDIGFTVKSIGPKAEAAQAFKTGFSGIFLRNFLTGTRRVSTSTSGGAPNGPSMDPSISPDGQQIVFSTDASNINPSTDANGVRDVVLVERLGGNRFCLSQCPGFTSTGESDLPVVSNNRRVAFRSRSAALQLKAGVRKASPMLQILLRDMLTGRLNLVSANPSGGASNGDSSAPVISASGDSVAYQSVASDLPESNGDSRQHVYLYQTSSRRNRRLSRGPGTDGKSTKLDGDSGMPKLSADGRFTVFQSGASNLVVQDRNGKTDVFVFDARTATLQRMGQAFGSAEPNGDSETPSVNRNGTRIGFESFAGNFTEDVDQPQAKSTSDPLVLVNPLAVTVVFADAFD